MIPHPLRFAVCAAVAASATLVVTATQSQVYRCLDESGRAQYTNVQADTHGRQCTLVQREVSVVPANAAPPSSMRPGSAGPGPGGAGNNARPGAFPRVDANTQRARDDGRRKILEDELAQEQRSLAKAREDLSGQEQVRNGDEKNYQRVLDRLKPYQEAVERHERNISALQKELGNMK